MRSKIPSFLIILIFGSLLLGLSFIEHNGHDICPLAVMSGGNCPPTSNVLGLSIHHLSGLQDLTQGIIGFGISFLALSILLLVVLSFINKSSTQTSLFEEQCFYQKYTLTERLFSPINQFFFWAALCNKRDTHTLSWVYDTCPTQSL